MHEQAVVDVVRSVCCSIFGWRILGFINGAEPHLEGGTRRQQEETLCT